MRLKLKSFVFGSVIGLFLALPGVFPSLAADYPQPVGYVNDFADMLSGDFEQSLEEDLSDFEKETAAEIAVVTVENLGGDYLENYAVKLFAQWGIGKEKEDNGLLILIAEEEREIRIEVGYGLEPLITDARAGRIIREKMSPSFKKEAYDQGVKAAVTQIQDYIRSGETPSMTEEVQTTGESYFWALIVGAVFLIYFASFWARSKRIWPGGAVGALMGVFLGLIIGSMVTVFLLAFFGLFLDWLLSKNYKKRAQSGKPTSFWKSAGGFSGGGRVGGGGFGGFGGGSSGGGGASGGW